MLTADSIHPESQGYGILGGKLTREAMGHILIHIINCIYLYIEIVYCIYHHFDRMWTLGVEPKTFLSGFQPS